MGHVSRSGPELAEFLEQLWERSTPGHWMVYSSNSWRRIGLRGDYKEIIWPCTHVSDGHVDLCGPNRDHDLALLMELRNHVPEILQALRAAASESRSIEPDTVIAAIIKDIRDRKGLGDEWENIDVDIRNEIIAEWRGFFNAANR